MPATTTYGIELAVELAIGRAADAGLWGAGRWGSSRWGSTDTSAGDWVDVTCDVLDGLELSAGSNSDDGVTRRWESASASFVLDGSTWDPWNGPHAEVIGDRTPARVRWRTPGGTWAAAFTGFIATRGYEWDPDTQQAAVACIDGTSILVATDAVPGTPQGSGETAAARVARIAAGAYWPGGTDITAGGTTLVPTTLGGQAWNELLGVADTDLALLWVNRAGALAYRPRGRVGPGTVLSGRLAVCPAGPGDVQVMTIGRAQPSVSRNRTWVSRRKAAESDPEAPVVYREDRQSIARFQAHDYKATDLWHQSDAWSSTVADAILGGGAWPSAAPGAAALDSITGDARVPPILLSLEPNMTFDVIDDQGRPWRQAVVGWDVTITHAEIDGVLHLEDVTRWSNPATWGTGQWGVDRWGIGGIS